MVFLLSNMIQASSNILLVTSHSFSSFVDFIANGPREPGVGAELVSPQRTVNYDLEFNQSNSSAITDTTNPLSKCNRMDEYDVSIIFRNFCSNNDLYFGNLVFIVIIYYVAERLSITR